MAFKEFQLGELGNVTIYKRRGTGSLHLSIRPNGEVRVTIPAWAPYSSGIAFAKSRSGWIAKHQAPNAIPLKEGQAIGKAHRLRFIASTHANKIATRIQQTEVQVTHPASMPSTDLAVQKAATQASLRALRTQAKVLLPIRLKELAAQHDFRYKSVSIKQLKTRWGSCDQDTNITLNFFLLQLPWQLIDYVLLHELTHTEVLRHGPPFWKAMARVQPNLPALRKAIRAHRPIILTEA